VAALAAWVLGVSAIIEAGAHALDRPIECERAFGPCHWRELHCTQIIEAAQREDCAWSEGYRTFGGTLGLLALLLAPIAAGLCVFMALKPRGAVWPWWSCAAACALAVVRLLWLGLASAAL
jgi:hypothetical protein